MTVVSPTAANDLADRFWERFLELEPITATIYGDDRFDDRLPDEGPAGRAAWEAVCRETLEAAEEIGGDGLDPESVITRDMLVLVARNQLESLEARLYQLAVNQMTGPQLLPATIAQYQPVDTPERVEKLLTRYRAYPTLVEQHIETLGEGLRDGRTSATEPVERTIEQIGRMLEVPAPEAPSVSLLKTEDHEVHERAARATETEIYPALDRYRGFLVDRYRGAARIEPGISTVPDGEAAYRLLMRMMTSVELVADDVHRFGLDDLARIDDERLEVARRLGFADAASLVRSLAQDPANRTDDRSALIHAAEEQTARAMAAAPRYFGRLPRAACIVKPVEEYRERESPPAFYMQPAADGSRPGQYYVNTYEPRERQLHKLPAITFHEATPGHHFQIAIEMELEGLPRFRRLGSRLAGVAYVEGWGLYAERLADEMGLYADDRERLGMLEAQAFRAARLVVDSGLHAFGWSRDEAVRFMEERGSLPRVDAEIEVDRYTVWPGQALAYKIGQREIERARAEIADRLGERFDLRAFHDQVLAHGSLPLATLRRELPAWVESAASTAAP